MALRELEFLFNFREKRQELGVAPPLQAKLSPFLVIRRAAALKMHGINGGTSAQDLGLGEGPPFIRQICPNKPRTTVREKPTTADYIRFLIPSCFDEHYIAPWIFGKSARHYASCRSSANYENICIHFIL
jgi:hypothetical protein